MSNALVSRIVALAITACLWPAHAFADDGRGLTVDWGKLGLVLLQAPAVLVPREHDPERADRTGTRELPAGAQRWVGLAPRMSVVARDWGASQLLVGDLTLTDVFRVTRSSRMMVWRVRLGKGRLVPFAQVGLGEWRVDRTLVPMLPPVQQVATQAGAGFELVLATHAAVALEVDWTLPCSQDATSQAVVRQNLWGALLVARARF